MTNGPQPFAWCDRPLVQPPESSFQAENGAGLDRATDLLKMAATEAISRRDEAMRQLLDQKEIIDRLQRVIGELRQKAEQLEAQLAAARFRNHEAVTRLSVIAHQLNEASSAVVMLAMETEEAH